MRRNFISLSIILLLIAGLAAPAFSNQAEKEAKDLYRDAKKESMKQRWTEAIEKFEKVVENYPGSRYEDDARFWIGYCQEKIPGRQIDAFNAYALLVSNFPNSTWTDDAIAHQITLAEQFVREGQSQYRSFLTTKIDHQLTAIRHQAALALGRLGDKKALPVLREMVDDENLGETAAGLIAILEQPENIDTFTEKSQKDIDRNVQIIFENYAKKAKELETGSQKDKADILFFSSKRYEHYRSMLKTENTWNRQEMMAFGLWHILPTKQFDEYFKLTNGYDKSEWLRKFWKANDPTPTTPKNEAREEFERRVLHAKSHFYQQWNYTHSRYLSDQHIRAGWDHAPWDARGEIYIKYGEPGFRTFIDNKTENWIYYGHHLDLVIQKYMTNIYGNAIFGTTIHGKIHGNDPIEQEKAEAEFVYNSQFIYYHDYQAKELKGFKVHELANADGVLRISYEIPKKELKSSRRSPDSEINYQLSYVVFDEDLREVFREEDQRRFPNINFKDNKALETIELHFPRGIYTFTMRIEVPNEKGKKLGIYKSEIRVIAETAYQTVQKQ